MFLYIPKKSKVVHRPWNQKSLVVRPADVGDIPYMSSQALGLAPFIDFLSASYFLVPFSVVPNKNGLVRPSRGEVSSSWGKPHYIGRNGVASVSIEEFRSALFVSEEVLGLFGGIFFANFEDACGSLFLDFFPLPETNKQLVLIVRTTGHKEVVVGKEINGHDFFGVSLPVV